MHCNTAGITTILIIRNRHYLAMLALLGINLPLPRQILLLIFIAGKIVGKSDTGLPIHLNRHPRTPLIWSPIAATTTAALIWADTVDTRLIIHSEPVNRPFGMINGDNYSRLCRKLATGNQQAGIKPPASIVVFSSSTLFNDNNRDLRCLSTNDSLSPSSKMSLPDASTIRA